MPLTLFDIAAAYADSGVGDLNILQDKVAIVTGGCGGIGSNISQLFASHGATVVVCDIAFEKAKAEAEKIGGAAYALALNVASEESWLAVAKAVSERSGKIDILINNAGINDRRTIMASEVESWDRVFAVNLKGPLLGIKAVAPHMRDAGGGAIVNVCSLASHHGEAFAAYGASKWALRGLTKIAAMEFIDWNIRVNSVSPAVVETELNAGQPYLKPMATMTPMGRNGKANEIANGALFLASDLSSFVTGQDLAIDGGFTAGAAAKYVYKLSKGGA